MAVGATCIGCVMFATVVGQTVGGKGLGSDVPFCLSLETGHQFPLLLSSEIVNVNVDVKLFTC